MEWKIWTYTMAARSPNASTCDNALWGLMKPKITSREVQNVDKLTLIGTGCNKRLQKCFDTLLSVQTNVMPDLKLVHLC